MTPAPLAGVVTRSLALTLRAKKRRIRTHLHRHHDGPLFIQPECHFRHSPWIFDAQKSRIESSILHRDTVPTRRKLDPSRECLRFQPSSDPHKNRKSRQNKPRFQHHRYSAFCQLRPDRANWPLPGHSYELTYSQKGVLRRRRVKSTEPGSVLFIGVVLRGVTVDGGRP
jgi:hypothetical protein